MSDIKLRSSYQYGSLLDQGAWRDPGLQGSMTLLGFTVRKSVFVEDLQCTGHLVREFRKCYVFLLHKNPVTTQNDSADEAAC